MATASEGFPRALRGFPAGGKLTLRKRPGRCANTPGAGDGVEASAAIATIPSRPLRMASLRREEH